MLGRLRTSHSTMVQAISSDKEENTPQPKWSVTEPSKLASPAAATSTGDVIDLTEGLVGLSSRKGKSRARDTSPPRSRSQILDLSGWEGYRSLVTGAGLGAFSSNASPPVVWGSLLKPLVGNSETTLRDSTSTQCYTK
ncbi:hypothetical protein BDM02DRAFT_935160 [Thelephora ganbajun]|uniref:Uncharacterized protein n=1 Tax=Thelephora ganbajun TaxID=370292 RepID=A0ACB6Z4F9_THEGA|nr:hypothetical protein BDM02DRAFT_935160 [Thelephora ganbajun]